MEQEKRLMRFKDASWLGQEEKCIVGGAGGISSWLAFMLARANFLPFIYDFDTLEEHNLGGQLFPFSGIGQLKVDVLAKVIKDFTGVDIWTSDKKYTLTSETGKIVFSGFDNMKARSDMFRLWTKYVLTTPDLNKSECIYLDGRLLAEQMQIFCIVGDKTDNMFEYKNTHLFSDEDVPDGPCTMRQTSHAAAIIAGIMTGLFTNHIHNVRTKTKSRRVPFKTEYFIPLNLFEE